MSYAEITFADKNPLKRWFQRQRLVSALKAVTQLRQEPAVICDFGAGNGELCKLLREHYPEAHLICYDPTLGLLNEAKENLQKLSNVRFVHNIVELDHESIDLIFSLEVFEHLPATETDTALQTIDSLLQSNGQCVIGVPVEIGIPALYKGAFRMARRYGAFDANIKNVIMSFLACPPKERPTNEITPGCNYHFEHMGFDYRKFGETLSTHFKKPTISSSPFSFIGAWLMPEIYFTLNKTQ